MLMSKTPLAVAVMLCAAGGLGVSPAAWSAQGSAELPAMVVSATGYKQETLRAPASITVVDQEQIQRKPVADLAEVLRDIPGVAIVDSGVAGMKRISLRGESSRRVLVKVNGQPIPDHSSYGSPLLLDVNMIERIEVVRGSASVVHGSNAIGGVVNITTRRTAAGDTEAFVGAGYYSATRGHRLNGGILGATDRFDWRLQASKADFGDRRIPRGTAKGTDDPNKYSRLKPSGSEQKSLSAELGWTLDERQRIAWQGDYFKQEAEAWLPAQENMEMGLDFPKRDSLRNALTYTFEDDSALFHSIDGRIFHQTGKRVMDNTINIDMAPIMTRNTFTRSHDKLTTHGLQFTAASRLFADNNTVFGFEYQKDKLDVDKLATRIARVPAAMPPVTTLTPSSQLSEQAFWSAFVQQQIKLTDSLEANLGARYYDIESRLKKSTDRGKTKKTDDQLVGSASLVWQYNELSSLRANIAQGYTYPSLTQQFSATPGNGAMNYGNPDLKAEKATTYEVGWRMEGEQLTADLALYHSKAKNFIDKVRISSTADDYLTACATTDICFQWFNANKASTTGVELMLAYQLESWRPYVNMGAQKRRLEYGTGLKTWDSGLPKFQGRAGVEWYATQELELDFYVRGGGKSRRDDYDSKGDPDRQRTSSYAELNVGAYYQPAWLPNLSVAVLAQNLANRRYRNPDELQAAGRALDVELRWSF
ncbi:TonB-dependent receptor plug domain-containing protein [Thiopseudomonas denitrificans]|uniref:Hemoglobin/transferrin/lactoferrin receptor protein n=1 Tax=Thiopseudomonas denitrificans TaxID=1501432 RepID=A0A4R6TZP1_9GAMM|nr:TonB-dependent receptor [Thiopseudomonas denitrificans]TDQ39450.1 hemoglobin/transferrin/lactoferrin receptor protein [Thiopseudomonas denitrificans]